MAAAREVKLDCEAPFSAAAARVVRVRAKEVFKQADGVLDLKEVERAHDMRVATRRLRAALEIFVPCFPRKRHRKALKRVKALADALGERRDADVEVLQLEELADAVDEADRSALRQLIEECHARRRKANDDLVPYLAPKQLRKLRKRLKKLVKEVSS